MKPKLEATKPIAALIFPFLRFRGFSDASHIPPREISDANRRPVTGGIFELPINTGKKNDATNVNHETPAKNSGFTLARRSETRQFPASNFGDICFSSSRFNCDVNCCYVHTRVRITSCRQRANWHQHIAESFALASRLRLTPCSAACNASARCTCGGMRTLKWPL